MFRAIRPRCRSVPGAVVVLLVLASLAVAAPAPAPAAVTSEQVDRAIKAGVRFLKSRQLQDGSWPDVGNHKTGVTSLVTLALLNAGERPDAPEVRRALEHLRAFGPLLLRDTYSIGLQTMVFAAAEPQADRLRILANVEWLEDAQLKFGDKAMWPGSWSYSDNHTQTGDNSNTQYALLGLNAAREAGASVRPETWMLSRAYLERFQNSDGGWAYTPRTKQSTGSMSCAGISSLIITGARFAEGREFLRGEAVRDCGRGGFDPFLARGLNWLAANFETKQNFGQGQSWKYYYLYGLERAGRLSGIRFLGPNDWYRQGAEELVRAQNALSGFWRGGGQENDVIATSFALLFLAKGRAPVLVNKLRHPPRGDWDLDPDDVRNLVGAVSRDWGQLLTWQVVDLEAATVLDLLQAPIVFFNGHEVPEIGPNEQAKLREFLDQGGLIFADACCGAQQFDIGFRELMKRMFPDLELHPLPPSHPIWRARHLLSPEVHPLWGIEQGCRTVVVYSPSDLSCYWNQAERSAANPAVIRSIKVGQNVVDYATGREMPADKLAVREVIKLERTAPPRRGALRIAKIRHSGDWNIAPRAIPNLMDALRGPPFNFDVVLAQKALFPRDPDLIHYPLAYIHGRGAIAFPKEDLDALRRHLEPGGGTLFADAACGSPAFDATFRRFVAELTPGRPLEVIPNTDELFTTKVGFDLSRSHYTQAAGGGVAFPQLEGVKINGHWAVIYSKFDIGCALERHSSIACKGYTYPSALRIAANIVNYSTLP